MSTEKRLDRLEKLYEKIYHDYELLSIYIPRLTGVLIKHLELSGDWRGGIHSDLRGLQSYLKLMDTDIKEHYKTHYLDKKKKTEYASKRKTYTIK